MKRNICWSLIKDILLVSKLKTLLKFPQKMQLGKQSIKSEMKALNWSFNNGYNNSFYILSISAQ